MLRVLRTTVVVRQMTYFCGNRDAVAEWVDANRGIENGACCRLVDNAGKVDSTPPPINPYIEPEKENPRSLK